MKLWQKLNTLLSDLSGNRFFETNAAKDIYDHYFVRGDRTASFLQPQQADLDQVYGNFEAVKATLDPARVDNFELTATYENGKLIDLSTFYADPNAPNGLENATHGILTEDEARPLLDSFRNIVGDCVSDEYTIKLYGRNRTGIEGWHTDGSEEVVGVLALEETNLTTAFKGVLGDLHAPEHSVAFVGDEEHSLPDMSRPTLHIIDLS